VWQRASLSWLKKPETIAATTKLCGVWVARGGGESKTPKERIEDPQYRDDLSPDLSGVAEPGGCLRSLHQPEE